MLHSSLTTDLCYDEMIQRNASKFAIFLEQENPKLVFISILSNFGFLIVKEKNILYGFFIPKIGQTILSDLLDNFIKYKPHISEVCMHMYRYVRPHSLIKSKNLDLESCSQLRMSTKFGIIFDIIEYTICHLFNSTYDFDFMNI